MLNPITLAFRYQQIGAITSWRLTHQAVSVFLDLAEGTTTKHPATKKENYLTSRRYQQNVMRGPDLKDLYGRRAHDVEVENI